MTTVTKPEEVEVPGTAPEVLLPDPVITLAAPTRVPVPHGIDAPPG